MLDVGVQYVFYTGSPGNVRFVPVRTKWNKLDGIVKEEQKTISDEDLHSSALLATSVEDGRESGYVLPPELLSLGASGTGILAVEFAAEGLHTLRIAVKDRGSGDVLFNSPVSVKALDVHKMYRWLDLGGACGVTNDLNYADRLTVQWPDIWLCVHHLQCAEGQQGTHLCFADTGRTREKAQGRRYATA